MNMAARLYRSIMINSRVLKKKCSADLQLNKKIIQHVILPDGDGGEVVGVGSDVEHEHEHERGEAKRKN